MQAQGPVASWIAAVVPDHHAAADLVQEVALALHQDFARYDRARPFTPWALGFARNLVHKRWRTLSRRPALIHDEDLLNSLAAIGAEMAGELESRETALRDCLGQVQGRAWSLLRWFYYDDLDCAAIAARMSVSVGNVRVMLNRTRNALRQCIERRVGDEK
jgi:RNA polymerase sigma-70 factor (ECF subfamily)